VRVSLRHLKIGTLWPREETLIYNTEQMRHLSHGEGNLSRGQKTLGERGTTKLVLQVETCERG